MNGKQKIKKAYAAILKNDFNQAISWFEQAIALEPNNAAYHYKLSITYARSNKLQQALQQARLAHALHEENEEYRFHLQHLQAKELVYKAEKYFDGTNEQLRMAVALLQKAAALDPLSTEALLMLGLAYLQLQDNDKALAAFYELLKLDPQHQLANQFIAENNHRGGEDDRKN